MSEKTVHNSVVSLKELAKSGRCALALIRLKN